MVVASVVVVVVVVEVVVVVVAVAAVVVAVAARHLEVDDEGMRDAREDLPFHLCLRDDLLVGGGVLTSGL